MDFSDALRVVKEGGRAKRAHWDALFSESTWLELVQPGPLPDGRVPAPQLVICRTDGTVHTFAGSVFDLLAEDWAVVSP